MSIVSDFSHQMKTKHFLPFCSLTLDSREENKYFHFLLSVAENVEDGSSKTFRESTLLRLKSSIWLVILVKGPKNAALNFLLLVTDLCSWVILTVETLKTTSKIKQWKDQSDLEINDELTEAELRVLQLTSGCAQQWLSSSEKKFRLARLGLQSFRLQTANWNAYQ